MGKAYRKRFVRSKDVPAHRFQDGDLEILQAVAEHRFLNTYQIQRLTGRGIRNLRRRLQYLYHAGFLDRPSRQQEYPWVSGPMVYALGDKGAKLLGHDKVGFDKGKIDWQRKNNKASLYFLDHTLMVADVRIALELATRAMENVELVDWEQGHHLRDRVHLPELGTHVPIAPDAFFSLRVADESRPYRHFLLEADRGTERHLVFLRKLKAYLRWYWHERGHQQLLEVNSLRVVTVTNNAARRDNLAASARSVGDEARRGLFLFGYDGDFKEEPGRILGPIWQTPAGEERQGLIG